jgi:hypothetical protein
VVRVINEHHRQSVISTVTNQGQMRWKIFEGALNTDAPFGLSEAADSRR